MNPRAGHLRAALFAAAGIGLGSMLAGPTTLAQEGPIVVGERQRPDNFALYNYRGAFEFLWRNRTESIDPRDAPRTRFRENRFEETITLEADGHIYHPNLVELRLGGTFGLTQSEISQTGVPSERIDGTISEYDLNATILRKEMAPLTLYTRRSQNQFSRQFGPTIDNTITTTGAIWDIRSETIPTRLEVFHSEQEQTGLGEGAGDFTLTQDTFLWHSEYRPRPNHTLTWDYTLSNVSEETEGFGENTYVLHDANLSYSIDFGPGARHNLTSSLSYLDQGGDFPIRRLRLNEFLRLRHTENFQTRYQYTYDQQSFSGVEQERHRALAGFTHRLYRSLLTHGNVGGELIDFEDGAQTRQIFGNLQTEYRKTVPFGVLTAFVGGALDRQENDARTVPRPVIDLPRTFVDPAPVTIVGDNIDPTSIVITDPSGLIVFQPGLDYELDVFMNRVEITRIIGGRIANGDTVLIDYLLLPQGENVVDSQSYFFGGRYDIEEGPFRGLGVYARYGRQKQDIDADNEAAFTPNEFTDVVFGAEYRIREWTFGAERQSYDSTIAPFDANRFFARYSRRFREDLTFNLNATYTQIEYPDIDNERDLLMVSGTVLHRITPRLHVSATVTWRDERDDLRGPTRGLEEYVQLQWYHRQTSVYALIRNSDLDTPFQDSSFQTFEIGLRRDF